MDRKQKVSFRNSKVNCSVVGCHNAYHNTDSSIKFYNFPGKSYEKERRKVWIQNIRRVNEKTGKNWEPKIYSKVCSAHFVGNKKSNIAQSPSYNPTLFPKQYKEHHSSNPESKLNRFNRIKNRSFNKESNCISNDPINVASDTLDLITINSAAPNVTVTNDFSCQVNFDDTSFISGQNNNFIFESDFGMCLNGCYSEAATQITVKCPTENVFFNNKKDKCVGNEDNAIIPCKGFHGYKSVKDSTHLTSLIGLTLDKFLFLFSLMVNQVHGNSQLTNEDKLLIFLMKMKLGISFTALGLFFSCHRTTISQVFFSVLNELVQKTRNFIYWPSRLTVNSTMPESFKRNYPQCRVIIDCTEVVIQTPNKRVDARIHTYSNYKSNFTAKFLIGINPCGFICFLSSCYGGRSSDAFITNDCGILNLLEANDIVLADKGFPAIKCKENVLLVVPPFVHDGHLTVDEIEETYSIASVRIHVERSIGRIKTYNILQKITHNLFHHIDDIVYMAGVLTNLQPPTIKEDD